MGHSGAVCAPSLQVTKDFWYGLHNVSNCVEESRRGLPWLRTCYIVRWPDLCTEGLYQTLARRILLRMLANPDKQITP